MKRTFTIEEFEAAERKLVSADARTAWRRHAIVFAIFVALLVARAATAGVAWEAYVLFALWGIGVGIHYVKFVRNGDARVREQQVRAEWRAEHDHELAANA